LTETEPAAEFLGEIRIAFPKGLALVSAGDTGMDRYPIRRRDPLTIVGILVVIILVLLVIYLFQRVR
jgi:hypothetical protein